MTSSHPSLPSPHAEGLVAQVTPSLAHVVQTSVKESAVLRVPQRRQNPLPILIQGVIQLCVAVNLSLEVLVTHALSQLESVGKKAGAVNSVGAHTSLSW